MTTLRKTVQTENWIIFTIKGMIGNLTFYTYHLKKEEYVTILGKLYNIIALLHLLIEDIKTVQRERKGNENTRKLSKD